MKPLKQVISENCIKMMAIGLENKPFHRNDADFTAMLNVWHEAIMSAGYTIVDAEVIDQAWQRLTIASEKWFYPKNLLERVRIDIEINKPFLDALPNLSDEQCNENLIRIEEMKQEMKQEILGGRGE